MKKRKFIAMTFMSIALVSGALVSCGGTNKPEEPGQAEVAIKSIALSDKSVELKIGETKQLTATVDPESEASKVAWSSSDENIATVSATGLVTAVADGQVTILASVGNKRAGCVVAVSKYGKGEKIAIDGLTLSSSAVRIGVGGVYNLRATISPVDATEREVTWSSSEDEKTDAEKVFTFEIDETNKDANKNVVPTIKISAKKVGKGKVFISAGAVSAEATVEVAESDVANAVIKEHTVINVWATFNDTYRTLIENAIAELSVEEPNLEVVYTKKSGSYSDLTTMVTNGFSANDYPDVAALYPDAVSEFISANKGLNMEPYMNNPTYGWSTEDKADVYASYLEEGQNYSVPGTYSLPAAKSTEAMYYDRRILGLNLASIDASINGGKKITEDYINNLTWDELFDHLAPALIKYNETLDDASKLIDTTNKDWAVFGYDSDDNLFITLAEQYGYGYTSYDAATGGSIDFNNNQMKTLVNRLYEAKQDRLLTTKGVLGGSTYVNTLANNNAVLFSVGSTGGVTYQFAANNPKDIGVALIPQAAGKAKKVISQGPSFAFLDHKDENKAIGSWLFYKKFAERKFCLPWSMTTGYSPIRASITETKDWLNYCDESKTTIRTVSRLLARNAIYSGEVGDYLFTSPAFKGSGEARVQVGSLLTAVLNEKALTAQRLNELFQTAYDNTIIKM
jgi:uncharacterized protein YjdB